MRVFFYGLFMDERLLEKKGIRPADVDLGFVQGYELRIGDRATLLQRLDSRAYGAVMEITAADITELYAEPSVADYVPENVIVELTEGNEVEAICYNLPADKISGTNKAYAKSLLEVASRLDFPDDYLDQIRRA